MYCSVHPERSIMMMNDDDDGKKYRKKKILGSKHSLIFSKISTFSNEF